MKNYSKQREAILEALRENRVHPTAGQIYEFVQKKIPNISLGTVYRNLAELSADGTVLSLNVNDGFEHFDGDHTPHLHLHCRKCGTITDLPLDISAQLSEIEKSGFSPDSLSCVINGICAECAEKNL